MTVLPVANFHGLGAPPIPIDADEQPFWLSREQYREALVALRQQSDGFLVTFDDGNLSDIEIGLPELREGEEAIVFVCADRIGSEGYLSAPQLRQIAAMPNVRLGSHGCAHRSWREARGVQRDREIRESKRIIEQHSDAPVRDAGIPFGDYDGSVLRAIRQAGYTTAYSSDGGPRMVDADLVPRLSLRGDRPVESQVADLLGATGFAARAKQEAKLRAKLLLK